MKRIRRKQLKVVVLLVGLVTLSACIFLPDFVGQHKAGKYEPAVFRPVPSATASLPVAETQAEPHTCGMHATRSLYRAYGLDPERFGIRFRLGTDQPAMRVDKDSMGTLHPDLYRVLAQDGFEAEPINLEVCAVEVLDRHLEDGQLALAVVYRSTYHWVLLSRGDRPGQVTVIDSLKDEPVPRSIDTLVNEALSITLVKPAAPGGKVSASAAHSAGLREMTRLYQRQ